jgi:L-lactate dehydrogenase complex protein LldG
MSSRDKILARIEQNKPKFIRLPIIDKNFFSKNLELFSEFKKKIEVVGGEVYEVSTNKEIFEEVERLFPNAKSKYSNLENSSHFNTVNLAQLISPKNLEKLDVFIAEGSFGVAENGAIWLTEKELPIRVLPFVTKHLVLVLEKSKIVENLHKAYELLEKSKYDFGIFISGPSKTADIEQSLVIGAQGALSLSVFIK